MQPFFSYEPQIELPPAKIKISSKVSKIQVIIFPSSSGKDNVHFLEPL